MGRAQNWRRVEMYVVPHVYVRRLMDNSNVTIELQDWRMEHMVRKVARKLDGAFAQAVQMSEMIIDRLVERL